MNFASVDAGFGRVKALSADRQLEFASVVGPWRQIRYVDSELSHGFLENLAVDYMGQKMFIGEMAYKQSTARVTMNMQRFCSAEGMALMLSAITGLIPGREIVCNLVAGLPVNAYSSLKEKYIRTLLGRHYLKLLNADGTYEDRHITIAQVKIIPQGLGVLFSHVLSENGQLVNRELATSKVGILDVGANTVDICRADSLEFIDSQSTSFSDSGIFECYKQMSHEIYNDFEIEIPPEQIEPYILNGGIRIGGQRHSIIHIKNRVYHETADRIVSKVRNTWRNLWQFDKIFVAGGGAVVLGEHISRIFNSPGQVELCRYGSFGNVKGYFKLGQRVWGK